MFVDIEPDTCNIDARLITTQAKTRLRRLLSQNAFAFGGRVPVGGTAGVQLRKVLAAPCSLEPKWATM